MKTCKHDWEEEFDYAYCRKCGKRRPIDGEDEYDLIDAIYSSLFIFFICFFILWVFK